MKYDVTINGRTVPCEMLQEVRARVAEVVTDRLQEWPDRVGPDAQMINMAFNTGAVEEALAERGEWSTTLDARGDEPVNIRVTREA